MRKGGRRPFVGPPRRADAAVRGRGVDLGRRGAARQRLGAQFRRSKRIRRARSCTSAARQPRPCRRSCRSMWPWRIRQRRCSGSTPARSAGGSRPRRRPRGLGEGFTDHSGRVGMAQDLAAAGVELPELMTAGRWKSSRMPARYTERQAAGRGAVARYYHGLLGVSIPNPYALFPNPPQLRRYSQRRREDV